MPGQPASWGVVWASFFRLKKVSKNRCQNWSKMAPNGSQNGAKMIPGIIDFSGCFPVGPKVVKSGAKGRSRAPSGLRFDALAEGGAHNFENATFPTLGPSGCEKVAKWLQNGSPLDSPMASKRRPKNGSISIREMMPKRSPKRLPKLMKKL